MHSIPRRDNPRADVELDELPQFRKSHTTSFLIENDTRLAPKRKLLPRRTPRYLPGFTLNAVAELDNPELAGNPRSTPRHDTRTIKFPGSKEVVIPELAESSFLQDVRAETNQALGEPDRRGSSTSDPIHPRSQYGIREPQANGIGLSYDQHDLTDPAPSEAQNIESISRQAPGHLQDGYRVKTCHVLMGTSVVGVATSLSLALWWSIVHDDPGSGFTIGSYVLAAFGVLVAIPAYPHSKVCNCWESRS